jgi:uncharacterized protein
VSEQRGITVSGTGAVSAPPDVVVLSLGVEATASSVESVLARATEAQSALRAALLEAGAAEADLRSGQTSLWTDNGPHGSGPVRHTARLGTAATVRDVASAGRVLSAALAAAGDAARMDGMSFSHADPAALADEARDKAFADAARKARRLASSAGRGLGEVLWVQEGPRPPTPGPMAGARVMAAAAEVAVDPGEQEVGASVTVCWAWD